MANLIVAGIILIIVGVAVAYIVKAKKNGVKCIGCPAAGNCSGKHYEQGNCAHCCGGHFDAKE